MKVLVAEKIAQVGIDILKKDFEVEEKLNILPDDLLECIGEYDALIVRSGSKVTKDVIQRGKNLKVIGRAGTGVDNIDLAAATERGIVVVNTPESNNISTAEHSIALMLALSRNITTAHMSLKEGIWKRSAFRGVELYDKTVVVMGMGRIGSIVASRLKRFGMKVLGYDPYIPDSKFEKLGVEKVEGVDDVMKRADYITLHLPITKETRGIIGARELSLAKPGLRIVNCARGGLVDEKALLDALKDKKIAGAALDVYENEPKEVAGGGVFDNPFIELDNVILTPHLGASTEEAQQNVGEAIASQVSEALKGNIVNAVNLSGLKVEDMAMITPYLNLGEILGKLYYAVDRLPIKRVEVSYCGAITKEETKLITLSCLSGLLGSIMEDRVNFVNVEMIVKDRGIEVVESTTSAETHYTNLVTIKVTNKESTIEFAGTVFGGREVRIVKFAGYDVDFVPTNHMVAIYNIDKPGIIGHIGTIVGLSGVNIATMRVSRNGDNDLAIAIINIDSHLPDDALQELQRVDGILKVQRIDL
ncbi:MAG: phosphoglycerate dehydrogenase [Clostridiales bacterium]|nr:phosphoglycerate dehydrogenase [Clostridiales bacterium]